jgi:hypothetical protein
MSRQIFGGKEGPSTEFYANYFYLHGKSVLQAFTTCHLLARLKKWVEAISHSYYPHKESHVSKLIHVHPGSVNFFE